MRYFIVDLKVSYFPNEKFSEGDCFFIKRLLFNKEKIIFVAIDEKWFPGLFSGFIKDLEIEHGNPNVVLVIDHLTAMQPGLDINLQNVLVYNSQLLKVASWEDEVNANQEINLDKNNFLFLMGKPYKQHRVGFLYELYKQGIIKNCEYSFKMSNPGIESRTRHCLPNLSGEEFIKFKESTLKDLDTASFTVGPTESHYVGFPIDVTLYKNTSFSVISESVCANGEPWFLSEKTWRTIANRHMFLPLFDTPAFDYLESIGITTFQNILPVKKEQFVSDVNVIIANTIENIKYLLSNVSQHQSYIAEGIENNYRVYKNLVNKSRSTFPKELEHHFYSSIFNPLIYKRIQTTHIDLDHLFNWSRQ